jgi:hypothetical protein
MKQSTKNILDLDFYGANILHDEVTPDYAEECSDRQWYADEYQFDLEITAEEWAKIDEQWIDADPEDLFLGCIDDIRNPNHPHFLAAQFCNGLF